MTVFGWDASDYDWSRGSMNIAAAAADGIVFFTHKATEGTRTVHAYYQRALNEARAAGIEFLGAYIVVRTPGNGGNGSVRDQVEFFLTRLDLQTPWWRSHPGFFLQVDLEHWSNSSGFVYDAVAPTYGIEACDLLHGTDKWVVLYAPKWAYGDSIGGDVPLWSSAYGKNPAARYRDAYPGDGGAGWQKYSGRVPVFWQYGSRLTIGSQPTCDANAYRGTLDELRTLIGSRPATTMAALDLITTATQGDCDMVSGELNEGSKRTMIGLDDVNSGLAKNGEAWLSFVTDPALLAEKGVDQVRLRVAVTDGKGWNVPVLTLGTGATKPDGSKVPGWRQSIQLATGINGVRVDRLDLAAPDDPRGQVEVGYCVMYGPKKP
jgi:hypothetical protein